MIVKKSILKLSALLLFIITVQFATAQNPAQPTVKYKRPVVTTYLGTNTGNGTTITVEEGKKIISLPLTVVDVKNNNYSVVSYQFSYKRIGVAEDDSTGKVSPQSDMVADRFSSTPLTAIWINTIQDELHSGEQLYFFDIVAKNNDGKLFFAPELRLIIQ